MTLSAAQLLRQLEPAVRPVQQPHSGGVAAQVGGADSFANLLNAAQAGHVQSGRQIAASVELDPPLEASQFERLAAAADQAEAAGAKTALMLIDGRALVLDVAKRSITGELTAKDSSSSYGMARTDVTLLVGKSDSRLALNAINALTALGSKL